MITNGTHIQLWRKHGKVVIPATSNYLIKKNNNDFGSIKNAKDVIKKHIPEIQNEREERDDGKPIALPIFFNNHKSTDASIAIVNKEIESLYTIQSQGGKIKIDGDLRSYFYPKYTNAIPNTSIFTIPQQAIVANAAFSRIPAALTHKTANQSYLALAKEYFLQ